MIDDLPPVLVAARRRLPELRFVDGARRVALEDLLARPDPADALATLLAGYGRLLVAAAGPILVRDPTPERFEVERGEERLRLAGVYAVESTAGSVTAARILGYPLRLLARRAGAVGSATPRLLCVGEREPRAQDLPLRSASGRWLLAALAHLGWDDLEITLANAYAFGTSENAALLPLWRALASGRQEGRRPAVVGLGIEAQAVLDGLAIPYVGVPHPAWHRRFEHREGVAGYARRLAMAGVPEGLYRVNGQPVAPAGFPREGAPALPAPFEALRRGEERLGTGPVTA